MSQSTQVKLAGSGNGRIILHLASLWEDGKLLWHARGILRELHFFPRTVKVRNVVCS